MIGCFCIILFYVYLIVSYVFYRTGLIPKLQKSNLEMDSQLLTTSSFWLSLKNAQKRCSIEFENNRSCIFLWCYSSLNVKVVVFFVADLLLSPDPKCFITSAAAIFLPSVPFFCTIGDNPSGIKLFIELFLLRARLDWSALDCPLSAASFVLARPLGTGNRRDFVEPVDFRDNFVLFVVGP